RGDARVQLFGDVRRWVFGRAHRGWGRVRGREPGAAGGVPDCAAPTQRQRQGDKGNRAETGRRDPQTPTGPLTAMPGHNQGEPPLSRGTRERKIRSRLPGSVGHDGPLSSGEIPVRPPELPWTVPAHCTSPRCLAQ